MNRKLTYKDICHMTRLYDIYLENINIQGNQFVIEWLRFNRLIKQNDFLRILTCRPFSLKEIAHRLRRQLVELELFDNASKIVFDHHHRSMINSQLFQSQAKSGLEAKLKNRLDQMMNLLLVASEKHY